MIGERIARYPDIVRRAVDDGHVIGNHSYTHPWLNKLDYSSVYSEIHRTDDLLDRLYRRAQVIPPTAWGAQRDGR